MHVEHAGGTEAQRLQDAVRGGGAVAARQRERVGHHVGVETDRLRSTTAAFPMVLVEVLVLALGGVRRDTLAADGAHWVADPLSTVDG